ncbi:hypothetical protein EAH68_08800 [Corynebacterium hylobatis]|uniref:Uncharacterized protein n=1 Tax=Corynebacterium hylobatis TaxID=1859290 RepID=A0A3S0HGS9_9CORY|nr:hypothetical protein [Corynebacterium hylobatis]RSZ62872.1 hypothetical protein EAH68_08800 [Corynebacterium hylobatis]
MWDQRHWLVLASAEGPDATAVENLRELLESHGLSTDAVQVPVIGGEATAIESAWLGEGAHTPYLQVHNISANLEQCRLLFHIAVTARLLIGVEPGPPTAIICGGVLDPEDYFEDPGECCVVDTPEQLHDCLRGNADTYRYAREA